MNVSELTNLIRSVFSVNTKVEQYADGHITYWDDDYHWQGEVSVSLNAETGEFTVSQPDYDRRVVFMRGNVNEMTNVQILDTFKRLLTNILQSHRRDRERKVDALNKIMNFN